MSASEGTLQQESLQTSRVQHAVYITVADERPSSSRRQNRRAKTEKDLVRELERLHEEYKGSRARKTPPVFGSPIFGPGKGQNFVRRPGLNPSKTNSPKTNLRIPKSSQKSSRRGQAKPRPKPARPERIRSPFQNFQTQIPTNPSAFIAQVQAEHFFHHGNFSAAVKSTNQAMLYDDTNAQLKMFAALSELANNNYRIAGQRFRQAATQLNFFDWSLVFENQDQLYGKNEFRQHFTNLTDFCDQYPNELDAIRFHGFLSFVNNDLKSATADFETILSSDRNDVVVNRLLEVAGQISNHQ